MKGLSLTLEIVIIAIVLLVTALVILTIFGGQMANILASLGILQSNTVEMSQCQTLCSNWCLANRPSLSTSWTTLGYTPAGSATRVECSTVMAKLGTDSSKDCKCTV